MLDPNDVFFVDVGHHLFVWVGKKASKGEKKEAMVYAERYLIAEKRPTSMPITRVIQGSQDPSKDFTEVFVDGAEGIRLSEITAEAHGNPIPCCTVM